MKIYNDVTEIIGKTPLVRLHKLEELIGTDAKILAKLEYMNPFGSVKDRVAFRILNDAIDKGLIKEGGTVIEPTSGNTGVGIAAICSVFGYKAIIVMPSTMSKERQSLIKAYGAEVILTDGSLGMSGAIKEAERLKSEIPNSIIAGQFVNSMNPLAHELTTAPEIFLDTDGNIDAFVAGVGTGGTISGVGKYLKEKKSDLTVVGVEPSSSAVLSGKAAAPHGIQGIGAGFIPDILDTKVIDRIECVEDEEAKKYARLVAKSCGVAVGISSGAAIAAAARLAKEKDFSKKTIVVLLPDGIDRYLSTDLVE